MGDTDDMSSLPLTSTVSSRTIKGNLRNMCSPASKCCHDRKLYELIFMHIPPFLISPFVDRPLIQRLYTQEHILKKFHKTDIQKSMRRQEIIEY
jgi:hypothetical protein